MKKVTIEEIEQAAKAVYKNYPEPEQKRVIQTMQYCRGKNGPVKRGGMNLNICSHSECSSCRQIEKSFRDYVSGMWSTGLLF